MPQGINNERGKHKKLTKMEERHELLYKIAWCPEKVSTIISIEERV